MSRKQLDGMLATLRQSRERTLAELETLSEDEFGLATGMERWTEVRRVLLRFGDHMREHATQISGTRADIDRLPTMAQRILAESEVAWGVLLAATVGLSDADLTTFPGDGGWTIAQTLEHIIQSENAYLETIRKARSSNDVTA